MKGTTHLTIGIVIGVAAACYYPLTVNHAAAYLTVAGFSALSPDLDGNSMLSSKLGQLSRSLKKSAIGLSLLGMAAAGYLYFTEAQLNPLFLLISVPLFLMMLITGQGTIRNALVSLIGGGILFAGVRYGLNWLAGFGLFVVWAPWLKHRGMTHTLWALGIWALLGMGLENHLHIQGIAATAAAGYASHLVADTLTPSGVKWLYPLYGKSIKLPRL